MKVLLNNPRILSVFNLLKRVGFVFLFLPLLSFAQLVPVWQRTIGGPDNDYPARAVELENGGILIGGTVAYIDFTSDFEITALSSNGDSIYGFVWDQTLPSYARDVFKRADGTCCVVGDVVNEENMETDFQIVTTTSSGHAEEVSSIWHSENDYLRDGISALDNGAYLVGSTEGGQSAIDFFVVKLDTDMREDWSRRYANIGGSRDEANCVYEMDSNSVYVAGLTRRLTFPSNQNIYFIKINAEGDSLWSMEFGDDAEEEIIAMDAMNDHQLVMAANYYFDGNGDILVVCMDTSGTICWQTPVGNPEIEELASDILVTATNILILGTQTANDGVPVIMLAAMNFQGDTMWTQTISGEVGLTANSIEMTANGEFIISGTTYSMAIPPQEDAVLIRMAPTSAVAPMVHLLPDDLQVVAYPNPFNGNLIVTVDGLIGAPSYTVFDILGRTLITGVNSSNIGQHAVLHLSLSDYSSGVYFVIVNDNFRPTSQGIVRIEMVK